jgi:hypothetical protein
VKGVPPVTFAETALPSPGENSISRQADTLLMVARELHEQMVKVLGPFMVPADEEADRPAEVKPRRAPVLELLCELERTLHRIGGLVARVES